MEDITPHPQDQNEKPHPIEHNYPAHEDDPGPSPEAVKEENDEGAGPAMKWTIPIVLIILFIIYWFMFRK